MVTLIDVVNDFLLEKNENYDNFLRYVSIAKRGMSYLHIYHNPNSPIKVVRLRPDSMYRVFTPSDFIDYKRIFNVVNGRIELIHRNESIFVNSADVCDVGDIPSGDVVVSPDDFPVQYYGIPGGTAKSLFNIDKVNGIIQLSSAVNTSGLVMEYFSNGLSDNPVMSDVWREPLIEWLHWRTSKSSQDKVLMVNRKDFTDSVKEARMFDNPLTLDEMLSLFGHYKTMAPRE